MGQTLERERQPSPDHVESEATNGAPPRAMSNVERHLTELTAEDVVITIPIAHVVSEKEAPVGVWSIYGQHAQLQARLDRRQQFGQQGLLAGLMCSNARLDNGNSVDRPSAAVRWIYERVADLLDQSNER